MPDNYTERIRAIDHEEASPIHQGEFERLTEALENLAANRRRHPAGLPGPGRCHCALYERHDGECLGPDCYCH